jgi:hypothetical protein
MRCGSIRGPRTPPIGYDLSNVGTSHGLGAVRRRTDKTGVYETGSPGVQPFGAPPCAVIVAHPFKRS